MAFQPHRDCDSSPAPERAESPIIPFPLYYEPELEPQPWEIRGFVSPNIRSNVAASIKKFEDLYSHGRGGSTKKSGPIILAASPSSEVCSPEELQNARYFSGPLTEEPRSLFVKDAIDEEDEGDYYDDDDDDDDDEDYHYNDDGIMYDSEPDAIRAAGMKPRKPLVIPHQNKAQKLLGLPQSRPFQDSDYPTSMRGLHAHLVATEELESPLAFASISTFSPFGKRDAERTSKPSKPSKPAAAPSEHRTSRGKDAWRRVVYQHSPVLTKVTPYKAPNSTLAGWGCWDSAVVDDEAWIDDILDHFAPFFEPPKKRPKSSHFYGLGAIQDESPVIGRDAELELDPLEI